MFLCTIIALQRYFTIFFCKAFFHRFSSRVILFPTVMQLLKKIQHRICIASLYGICIYFLIHADHATGYSQSNISLVAQSYHVSINCIFLYPHRLVAHSYHVSINCWSIFFTLIRLISLVHSTVTNSYQLLSCSWTKCEMRNKLSLGTFQRYTFLLNEAFKSFTSLCGVKLVLSHYHNNSSGQSQEKLRL